MSDTWKPRQPVRLAPGYTDYAKREAWCRANGHEVGRNGWLTPAACAAYRQHEIGERFAERLAAAAREA